MKLSLVFSVLGILLVVQARAERVRPAPRPSPTPVIAPLVPEPAPANKNVLSISFGAAYFNYAEAVTPPKKSTETGTMPALRVSYEREFLNGWGMIANLETYLGKSTYDGSTQSGVPVTIKNSPQQVISFEALATKNVTSEKRIVLYAGTGVHYWLRGDGKGGPGDYQERYLWLYLPVGAQFYLVKQDGWDWAADVSLRINAGGTVRAYNSQADPQAADADLPLALALGGRVAFPLNFRFSDSWGLRVLPYAEYLAIGEGAAVDFKTSTGGLTGYTLHEPASRTWFLGVFVGPSFRF